MAVTENMVYNIQVNLDAEKPQKAADDIKASLLKLSSITGSFQQSTSKFGPEFSKMFEGVQKNIDAVVASMNGIDGATKKAKSTFDSFKDSLGGVATSMIAINQGIELAQKAYNALVGPIKNAIAAYAEKEAVIAKLSKTLKLTGAQDIPSMTKSWVSYADAVRKSSIIDAERVLGMVAQGKAMQLNDDLIKKMIKTSIGLSSVFAVEAEDAFSRLTMTLKGDAGRIAALAPEIKNLTEAQIKNGAAIEMLGERYDKFANKSATTLIGKKKDLTIAMEDLDEEMGRFASTLFNVPAMYDKWISSTKGAVDVLSNLSDALPKLSAELEKLTPLFAALGAALLRSFAPQIVATVLSLVAAVKSLTVATVALAAPIALATLKITAIIVATDLLVRNWNNVLKLFPKIGKFFSDIAEKVKLTIDKIKSYLRSFTQSINDYLPLDMLKKLGVAFDGVKDKVKSTVESVKKDMQSKDIKWDPGMVGAMANIGSTIGDAFGEANTKIEETSTKIMSASEMAMKTSQQMAESLAKLKTETIDTANKIRDPYAEAGIRISVFGNEFKKAKFNVEQATRAVEYFWVSSAAREKGAAEAFNKLRDEKTRAELEIQKLQLDTFDKLDNQYSQLRAEQAKNSGSNMLSIQREGDARLAEFYRVRAGLIEIGVKERDRLNILKIYEDQIKKSNQIDQHNELIRQKKILSDLDEKAASWAKEVSGLGQSEVLILRDRLVDRAKELKAMELAYEKGELSVDVAQRVNTYYKLAWQAYWGGLAKIAEDIKQKNLDIEMQMNKSDTASISRIMRQLDLEKQKIDTQIAQIESVKIKGEKEAEIINLLTRQKILLNEQAAINVWEEQKKSLDMYGMAAIWMFETSMSGVDKLVNAWNSLPDFSKKFDEFGIERFFVHANEAIRQVSAATGILWNQFDTKVFGDIGKKLKDGLSFLFNVELPWFDVERAKGIGLNIAKGMQVGANFIVKMFDTVKTIFDPENINKITESLTYFLEKLPDGLIKAFGALGSIIDKVIDKLPGVISKLMDSLPSIIDNLMQKLPALIEAITQAVVTILDKLPTILQSIFDKLPEVFDAILSRLPQIITSIFRMIPTIIGQLLKTIPELIVEIFQHLPDIIESIINGITEAVPRIIMYLIEFVFGGGLAKIIESLVKMIPKLIMMLIRASIKATENLFTSVLKGPGIENFSNKVENLPEKLDKGMQKLAKNVAKDASQIFKVLDLEASKKSGAKKGGPTSEVAKSIEDAAGEASRKRSKNFLQDYWDGMVRAWRWWYDQFAKWLMDPLMAGLTKLWRWVWDKVLSPIWGLITKAWQWVWDKILIPIINALKIVWMWIYEKIINPIIKGLKEVWMAAFNNLSAAWEGMKRDFDAFFIQPTINAFNFLKSIWDFIFNGLSFLWELIKTIFNDFIGGVKNAWDSLIGVFDGIKRDFWDPLVSSLAEVFGFFETAWKIFELIWRGIVDWFGKFFSGLGQKIADSLSTSDLGAFFSKFGEKINSTLAGGFNGAIDGMVKYLNEKIGSIGNFAGNMFKFDGGGKGTIEKTLNIDVPFTAFAFGGKVGGWAGSAIDSLSNDKVPAMLSPGEYVIPRSVANIPGVSDILDALSSGDIASFWQIATDKLYSNLMKMFEMAAGNFYEGGIVGMANNGPSLAMPTIGQISNAARGNSASNYNFDIKLNIETKETSIDQNYVRTRLIPTIKEELKKASLRGEFVIADRGIRTL